MSVSQNGSRCSRSKGSSALSFKLTHSAPGRTSWVVFFKKRDHQFEQPFLRFFDQAFHLLAGGESKANRTEGLAREVGVGPGTMDKALDS